MSELDAIRTFYRYNARVRRRYLEAILALPEAERLRDRGASYPSLQEIYVHALDGLRFWFAAVPLDRVAEVEGLPGRAMSPAALRDATEEVDRLVTTYLETLGDPDLARSIVCHFDSVNGPTEASFPVGDILWHMVEEELQHRGELNALLWQMDVEPPIAQVADWNSAKTAR